MGTIALVAFCVLLGGAFVCKIKHDDEEQREQQRKADDQKQKKEVRQDAVRRQLEMDEEKRKFDKLMSQQQEERQRSEENLKLLDQCQSCEGKGVVFDFKDVAHRCPYCNGTGKRW